MRVGASRTAPDLTITAPHRSALAPAAQPRPASPRRALPSARVSKRVPIPRKSGVPVQCSLTAHRVNDRDLINRPPQYDCFQESWEKVLAMREKLLAMAGLSEAH